MKRGRLVEAISVVASLLSVGVWVYRNHRTIKNALLNSSEAVKERIGTRPDRATIRRA